MSDLTEPELIACMREWIGETIAACDTLAVSSLRGRAYDRLRDHLALIEGACRQMASFRGDTRWLTFGLVMHQCHARAGGWLRGYTVNGVFIPWGQGDINHAFIKLGAQLRAMLDAIEKMSMARTNTMGPVLRETPPEERRFGRPSLDTRPRPQLILPAKYRTAS